MTSTVGERAAQSAGRAARRRDRRKAEIIAVTLRILAASGYQGMNLEDVAERTDIAKATLYHYFPSKDALVTTALDTLTNDVLTRLKEALAAAADRSPADQLRILVAEQLRVLTVLYPEVGKLFSGPGPWPAEHGESIETMRRRHDSIFREVVERGVESGEFDCPDPSVALHCLHGILNHTSTWLRQDTDPDGRRRAAVVEEALRLFA